MPNVPDIHEIHIDNLENINMMKSGDILTIWFGDNISVKLSREAAFELSDLIKDIFDYEKS